MTIVLQYPYIVLFIARAQPKYLLVNTEYQGKGDEPHLPGGNHNLRQTRANKYEESRDLDYSIIQDAVYMLRPDYMRDAFYDVK